MNAIREEKEKIASTQMARESFYLICCYGCQWLLFSEAQINSSSCGGDKSIYKQTRIQMCDLEWNLDIKKMEI